MRLPRNWIPHPLTVGAELQLPPGVARHIRQVLRMQVGQEVLLFNGLDGRDYRGSLLKVDKKGVFVQITSMTAIEPLPDLRIKLALGISRGERMDIAIQKSVELGVQEIAPLITARTQVKLPTQRREKRLQHWRGIVINACEQSGRRRLPELQPMETYQTWLERREENVLFMDPEAETSLADLKKPESTLCFLIGPEGGFSQGERKAALATGCRAIRLGPRILRTETAPLAAMAAAQILWGDFV